MTRAGETARISTIPRPIPSAPAEPPAGEARPAIKRFRDPWGECWRWALTLAITGVLAVVLLLGSLFAAIWLQSRSDESRPVDAIVVLGTAQYNGRPSPVLQARLDEVIAAYAEGLAPVIVVTGGGQPGDAFTEAESSRDYLVEHGIPESAILLENEGRNSWQSIQGAAKILDEEGLHSILLVTDGFHLFRVKMLAEELGLSAYGRPASDSPIEPGSGNEFDYIIREGGAVIAHVLGS